MTKHKNCRVILLLVLPLAWGSCAPLQPPSATGPKGNEPVYPVLFTEDDHRRETSLVALRQLTQQSADSGTTELKLQPITATIESLPANPSTPFDLPKVGAAAVMNEEETRESLRRFIEKWHGLIGAAPEKLSLIERLDQPDGSKLANYEQRPFRYPIRGNYGKLQIRFATDRRILDVTSTCIPDADRMQAAMSGVAAKLKAEDAIAKLQSFNVPAAAEIRALELVTYILPSKSKPNALEFHLAWELQVGSAPSKIAYVDAVNGEIIAT